MKALVLLEFLQSLQQQGKDLSNIWVHATLEVETNWGVEEYGEYITRPELLYGTLHLYGETFEETYARCKEIARG